MCHSILESASLTLSSWLTLIYRAAIELDKEVDGSAIRAVMGDMVGR